MRHFRFTIAHLLGLALLIAVGFAALREATELWDSAVFSTTLGVLSVAVLLAIHRADRSRAYWLRFAVFGWIALGASLVPPIESRLLTTRALAWLDAHVPGRVASAAVIPEVTYLYSPGNAPQVIASTSNGGRMIVGRPGTSQLWNTATGQLVGGSGGTTESFLRIGHSIVALVLAYLGGHLSHWLFASRRPTTSGGDSQSPPAPHP
jgi:hypothetical protein